MSLSVPISNAINDSELIKQFRQGSQTAMESLINRYKSKIYTSVLFIVKNKQLAEDIFQETFIKIIDTLRTDRYNEENKFLPWALRISHNLCVDYFRKAKRMQIVHTGDSNLLFEMSGQNTETADGHLIKQQTNSKVEQMLMQLHEEQRVVIVLRYFANLSFKEIAKITDCSINTSLGRMRYGLINLKRLMVENKISL